MFSVFKCVFCFCVLVFVCVCLYASVIGFYCVKLFFTLLKCDVKCVLVCVSCFAITPTPLAVLCQILKFKKMKINVNFRGFSSTSVRRGVSWGPINCLKVWNSQKSAMDNAKLRYCRHRHITWFHAVVLTNFCQTFNVVSPLKLHKASVLALSKNLRNLDMRGKQIYQFKPVFCLSLDLKQSLIKI